MTAKKSVKKAGSMPGRQMVPQKHGGSLWCGPAANPVAGTGRPPDAIRAAMRELGAAKGLPFLSGLLDGKIPVRLVGTCASCKTESVMDSDWLSDLMEKVGTSVDHRLKANEQALKYGLGTKEEMTIVSPDVKARLARQIDVITAALHPEQATELLAQLDAVWS